MTQTSKKDSMATPSSRQNRPGQRQRERLMRLERRRRRQRIWTSVIIALALIAVASLGVWQYQRYSSQQAATAAVHATATATKLNAIATAHANATATVIAENCFVSPPGTATTNIYSSAATPTAGPTTSPPVSGKVVTQRDGLKYIDIKVGTGPAAKQGSTVNVEYTGWTASNCQKFDSSYDRGGQPFAVTPLGQASIIPGWNEGLIGMKAGGTRRLLLPPSLAYGAAGSPPTIPANATLIFDVTVLSVK
jgi:FKBP-type peptidyl-prolyl cis-trans isomerase